MSEQKTRSDSVVDGLPQNQREAIEQWIAEENLSYINCSKRCWQDFGVRVSKDSVRSYYLRRAQERTRDAMLQKIATSRKTANLVTDQFRRNPADTYQALLDMAGQIAFEKSMEGGEELDAETIFNFTKLVIQGKKEARADLRLQMLQQKLELEMQKYKDEVAERKKEIQIAIKSGGLTPETLQKIEEAVSLL